MDMEVDINMDMEVDINMDMEVDINMDINIVHPTYKYLRLKERRVGRRGLLLFSD